MCGVRCILKTGVVKVRSTCNKEIGSRLFWGSYVHKREEIANCVHRVCLEPLSCKLFVPEKLLVRSVLSPFQFMNGVAYQIISLRRLL